MDITFEYIAMALLVFLTGLSAGLCFTWTNAITPGIGRLDDMSYLLSFQQMNRTIVNPMFLIAFFGPAILGLHSLIAIYFEGVVLVTIFGNVPLNNILDATELSTANQVDLKTLRDLFEVKWNHLHLIRTISATVSFALLIISLIQITKNTIVNGI